VRTGLDPATVTPPMVFEGPRGHKQRVAANNGFLALTCGFSGVAAIASHSPLLGGLLVALAMFGVVVSLRTVRTRVEFRNRTIRIVNLCRRATLDQAAIRHIVIDRHFGVFPIRADGHRHPIDCLRPRANPRMNLHRTGMREILKAAYELGTLLDVAVKDRSGREDVRPF